jgi:hypothetical protein
MANQFQSILDAQKAKFHSELLLVWSFWWDTQLMRRRRPDAMSVGPGFERSLATARMPGPAEDAEAVADFCLPSPTRRALASGTDWSPPTRGSGNPGRSMPGAPGHHPPIRPRPTAQSVLLDQGGFSG